MGQRMSIKNLLKSKFKPWNGLYSIMEGGWRLLPVRMDGCNFSGAENILAKEIRMALKKYKMKVPNINAFSMVSDGTILVQLKNSMIL
jgi:hypothetical protein